MEWGFRSSRVPLVREAVDTARSLTIITRRISSNAIAIDVKFQSRPVWAGFNHPHGKVPRQPLLRLRVGAFISHILPFLLSLDSRHIPALSLGLNHRAPVLGTMVVPGTFTTLLAKPLLFSRTMALHCFGASVSAFSEKISVNAEK